MPEKRLRAELLIRGRVQGVWFRGTTREVAQSLGLNGYVRNTPDGGVEVVLEGPESRVRRAVAWCRQGPRLARVSSVDVAYQEPAGQYVDFSIRY